MNRQSCTSFFLVIMTLVLFNACKKGKKWEGQAPIKVVPTTTLPIQKQNKGVFNLGQGVYASNDFDGARLNGIVLTDDTLITALITPENTPINPSPWYAFKLWSKEPREISLKMTYQEGAFHRYYPKLSKDGLNWTPVEERKYRTSEIDPNSKERPLPKEAQMQISIGPDTLWIAAQELITSKHVASWIDRLDTLPYISAQEIGLSREGRPIEAMKIGTSDDQKLIFVLSRQHPPEVTGYLAMESFVETIASNQKIAEQFRAEFNTYVIPLANPDGVDHGHWRHNTGGIDLNRDWGNVNQPEVQVIQQFLKDKVISNKGTVYLGVDFHSTWEDIYYTLAPEAETNRTGLVREMVGDMSKELNLDPNINDRVFGTNKRTSSEFFFFEFAAETLTYEIGDNTPRDLVKRKGEVSALKLMERLLENKKATER